MGSDPMFWVVAASVLLVAGILIYGIMGFSRDGDSKKANKVMQWRIIAQFVAVLLILLFVFLRGMTSGEG